MSVFIQKPPRAVSFTLKRTSKAWFYCTNLSVIVAFIARFQILRKILLMQRYVFILKGAWALEGDVLKGTFTRKDNGKALTTTRVIQGDEMIQVRPTPISVQA